MPVTRLFAARDDGGDRRAVAELILGIVLRTDVVAPRGDALHAHRSGRNAAVDDCHAHGGGLRGGLSLRPHHGLRRKGSQLLHLRRLRGGGEERQSK